MSIVWSLIWGMLVFCVMYLTIKYYLPNLSERVLISMPENLEITNEKDEGVITLFQKYNSFILNNKNLKMFFVVICACFSGWCGYVAYIHSISMLSMIKMTITMCVLSCIFITDMEFMIIPNICSVCMVICRLVIMLLEFIWLREEVIAWVLNSICAMIISLILLVIVSVLTRGGIGMGDVKILSSLGFMCGIRAVYFSVMFAFIFCAIVSTVFLVIKKKTLKDSLPLGPFIWLGYGVTVLLGIM